MTPLVFAQRTGSNQSISATTHTKIVFNTEHIDTGSIYNNSTGLVTIADAGKYFVTTSINVRALTGSSNYAGVQINNSARNLSNVSSAYVSGYTGYGWSTVTASHIKSYSASDTIAIWIYATEACEVAEPSSSLTIFKIIE